jgi:hypothetical protein
MRRPRNPFGPIRVPAGKAGDAIIDWLCKIYGVSREEACKAGEESMKTTFRMSPVIPRPMRAPVGACLLMDEDDIEKAKVNNELGYTKSCLNAAKGFLGIDDPDMIREISSRHYYSTRYVLELVDTWITLMLAKHPSLADEHTENIQWAIKTVTKEANEDLDRLRQQSMWMKMQKARREQGEDDGEEA